MKKHTHYEDNQGRCHTCGIPMNPDRFDVIPKIHIKKNSQWPALWSAYWKIGTITLYSWGYSPKEAFDRLLREPSARNKDGFYLK